MTDRAAFDTLKVSLLTEISTESGPRLPVSEAMAALKRQGSSRQASLVSLGVESIGAAERAVLDIADVLAASAAKGIRSVGVAGVEAPVETLVDLLGHAEAIRALWYDVFIGVKKGTAASEQSLLKDSAKQLVAEASSCAALVGGDASQLVDFARNSGLLA
jgi:hypothetical protein